MKLVGILGLILVLSGCGLQKIAEDTRDGVKESNGTQKQLLDTVDQTKRLTEELKSSIKKTEEGVHLQILTVAFQQMFQPENTLVLNPPTRLMPYAEVFAKEATSEEILKCIYLLVKDAENTPNDKKGYGELSVTVLTAIAGLTPDDKAVDILKGQVEGHGRFEDTALTFGLARYNFIRDYLFSPILDSKTLNLGSLKENVKYFTALKGLSKLDYSARFALDIPAIEVTLKLDTKEAAALGIAAKKRFERSPSPDLKSSEALQLLKKLE